MPIREESVENWGGDDVYTVLRGTVREFQRAGGYTEWLSVRNIGERDCPAAIGKSSQEQGVTMTTLRAFYLDDDNRAWENGEVFITLIIRDTTCGCVMNIARASQLEVSSEFELSDDPRLMLGTCAGFNWEDGGFYCNPLGLEESRVELCNEPDEPVSSN